MAASLPDLAGLFPASVRAGAVALDEAEHPLPPAETALVARALPVRRAEFAAGRLLARRLLAELGIPVSELQADADRVPRWPAGVTGSIAHTRLRVGEAAGCCVVAVVSAGARGPLLGIDIEPAAPLGDEALAVIATDGERARLAALALPPEERAVAARAVFCAKEAAFKAHFPHTRTFLEFADAEVSGIHGVPVDQRPLDVTVRLLRPAAGLSAGFAMPVRVARRGGYLLAACYVAALP